MRAACIAAVKKVLGRDLGAGEARGIEERILKWKRLLARKDQKTWQTLSNSQRLDRAAKAAANELMAEIKKERQQISLQVIAWDRFEAGLNAAGKKDTFDGAMARLRYINRTLAFDPGVKGKGPSSLESRANAMTEEAQGKLLEAFKAADPKLLGLIMDDNGIKDLVREIYGQNTGNAVAKNGADAWRKTHAEMRDRYNAAGGHMGDLGEEYFPNHHDRERVGNAGFDGWFNAIEPLLNKGKYLNADGSNMKHDEMRDFFSHVFDTIVTDGDSKAFRQPAQAQLVGPKTMGRPASSGHGLIADRNSQHRQVFFKDGDSFIQYQQQFGTHSFFSSMLQHTHRLARDTAILESHGPWAQQMHEHMNNREMLNAKKQFTNAKQTKAISKVYNFNNSLWDFVSGSRDIVDSSIARKFQAYRNIQSGLKLGKVVWTALGDEAGMAATAWANKIPYTEVLKNEMRVLNPLDHTDRAAMESFGIGVQSMVGAINRYTGEYDLTRGASGKFANFVMRVTGAERLWDSRKQAMAMTLMHQLGGLTRTVKSVNYLNESDHGVLARKGIGEQEWQTMRLAGVNVDGAITPHTIWSIPDANLAHLGDPKTLKRNATTAMMAHISEEASMGIMQTGSRERARIESAIGKLDENKLSGQLAKSIMLFKTFSSAMVMKHWARMGSMGTLGSKAMYGSILGIYGTIIAATVNAIVRPFLNGQDPPPLDWKFLVNAVLRGGGLGFYGDFLYDQLNSRDNSLGASLLGVLGTDVSNVYNLTLGDLWKIKDGKKTDELANLIRFARDNTPLANLWYTQAIWDHLVWFNLQEMANPGYLDRMMDRQEKYGRNYFWNPHDVLPSRGPSADKVIP